MALNIIQIGKRIKAFRKKRGLSQDALSAMAGCSPAYLSHLESGEKCMSFELFIKIANSLNVSADELLMDNLANNIKATNHELAQILTDCDDYEKRILLDVITAAKASLRENRSLIRTVYLK